jgi:hypothetical protein
LNTLQQFPGRFVGNDLNGSLFYLTQIQVEAQSALGIGVAARNTARELTNALPEGSLVQVRGGLDGYVSAQPMTGQLDEVVRLNGIGFGFDFVIGFGFQYAQDRHNPYLTTGQVVLRAGTSGVGGAVASALAVSALCGPGAPVCVVLAGVGGGLIWAEFVQPRVFQISIFQPADRNLKQLSLP